MKLSKHSAQKSKLSYSSARRILLGCSRACSSRVTHRFCPSSCFCSSVNRYLVCVTSNLPAPMRVTRQTRRLVPPRSSARYSPFSSPVGHCGKLGSVRMAVGLIARTPNTKVGTAYRVPSQRGPQKIRWTEHKIPTHWLMAHKILSDERRK